MSSTRPELNEGEAPLDGPTVVRLLGLLGHEMVLVGGQALAYWMARFDLLQADEVVSNDGDALGSVEAARDLAQALHARLIEPSKHARTALVAQLHVPVAQGMYANIDVLHQLYTMGGLRKSAVFTRRVIRNSVEVTLADGATRFRVMDPFDLLESRIQNAAGLLESKGPHVITQARWAVEVARVALLRLARHDATLSGRLGAKLRAIFTLAGSQPGRKLLKEHQIEILKAVDLGKLRWIAPAHEQQLARIEAALTKRGRGA